MQQYGINPSSPPRPYSNQLYHGSRFNSAQKGRSRGPTPSVFRNNAASITSATKYPGLANPHIPNTVSYNSRNQILLL